jgi:hypothetical protein
MGQNLLSRERHGARAEMSAEPNEVLDSAQAMPSSSERVEARLREIEAAHDIFRYEVGGWCAWPLLRFAVGLKLSALPITNAAGDGWASRAHRLVRGLPIVAQDLLRMRRLRPARYCVVCYSSSRTELAGSKFKDHFCDDLLLELGDYFKIEHVDNPRFQSAARAALVPSDLTFTAFDLLSGLLSRSSRRGHVADVAEQLSRHLRTEPGLEGCTKQWVAATLERFVYLKRLFAWLLRRVRPRFLLMVTAYCDHAVVAAAKESGIPVIEFQHGVISRCHWGYSWTATALPYKQAMPIPDRIFLFGDYWKTELEANGFWGDALTSVGSLRLDQYRKGATRHPSPVRRLLVTTQGVDTEKLIAFITDFLGLAHGRVELTIDIKLHPAYERSKRRYDAALGTDPRVRILASDEAPFTLELLAQADVHASISSTCHYEAIALGVPTVILPFTGYDDVMPLYHSGHALLARTPGDLLELVGEQKPLDIPEEVRAQYFRPGALQNIMRELDV